METANGRSFGERTRLLQKQNISGGPENEKPTNWLEMKAGSLQQ